MQEPRLVRLFLPYPARSRSYQTADLYGGYPDKIIFRTEPRYREVRGKEKHFTVRDKLRGDATIPYMLP